MFSFQFFDRIRRELIANSIHSADSTQLGGWVASSSAVCIRYCNCYNEINKLSWHSSFCDSADPPLNLMVAVKANCCLESRRLQRHSVPPSSSVSPVQRLSTLRSRSSWRRRRGGTVNCCLVVISIVLALRHAFHQSTALQFGASKLRTSSDTLVLSSEVT